MTQPGRLYLMPNTLDFGVPGAGDADLQDVLPLGVIRIAAALTHWVAENAKTTRAFLKRVDAVVPLAQPLQAMSIVELPRPVKGATSKPRPPKSTGAAGFGSGSGSASAAAAGLDTLLAPCRDGHDIGLISEAGLPAVADPGAALVQAAHVQGIVVTPLSGPSSLLLALAASGLNGQSFAFVGYLPVDAAARTARIRELEALSRRASQTQLMIETPYRNEALLGALVNALDVSTRLSISCGLTLADGWTRTDTIARWRVRPGSIPNNVPAVFGLLGG